MSEELIVEQLGRFQERVEARFNQVEAMLRHNQALDEKRLQALQFRTLKHLFVHGDFQFKL